MLLTVTFVDVGAIDGVVLKVLNVAFRAEATRVPLGLRDASGQAVSHGADHLALGGVLR